MKSARTNKQVWKKILMAGSLLPTGISTAQAGNISKNFNFTAGATISASEMNSDFDQLFLEINGKETRITTLENSCIIQDLRRLRNVQRSRFSK